MEFRQVLSQLMAENNITQYRLSKQLDIAQSTIGSWLKGGSMPHKSTQRRLAEYFGVSVEYLLTGKKITPTDIGEREELLAIHDGLPEEFRLVLLEQARSLAKALRSADSQ